ncbi:response regulator transcription factor [Streptomyces johnsoniae]|uniref:LuxR C-terminal-related transcriptional regulator n=1 Tax=Streptomyces johnsoniae TaxID=3075532 RepID=A0ABU2S5J6_9ACTN|nr:LuxR C-terminal-related transcriptional regulator [Streptomyces sp. DSM 41886]MDT0444202.1 LuxR C-terminal-related transcriptional regulator [Streptomyces sp. DSM 41886]
MSDKQIAARLRLSVHTVGTHVRSSFSKLNVTNRVGLARKIIYKARAGVAQDAGSGAGAGVGVGSGVVVG